MAKSSKINSPPPESYKQPSATPYTPFSPFKTRSKSHREYVTSLSASDSALTMSSPTASTTASSNYEHFQCTNDSPIYIGSKTETILSPNGNSIQLAPTTPHVLSPKKRLVSDSTTISPIFRQDIRREWINAMFGTDFFPEYNDIDAQNNDDGHNHYGDAAEYTPPRQGMGLAAIPSYLSYTAKIPPAKEAADAGNKVGMTLSRIPIGVYVRLVDIESEAYAAGIVPGSVLIDINGMGVLGEPSHKLLERLWKFEGHFNEFVDRDEEMKNDNCGNEGSGGEGGGDIREKKIKSAVMTLKLIKDGRVYSVMLMSGSALGISWAPCGNFALVQRTYAMAQKAGVRRGCIVAAVNDKSLREMNHLDTAMYLKEQFDKGIGIRVVCVFTPAASRTGHFDRKSTKVSQKATNEFRSINGVRIRKVSMAAKKNESPTEYGVGSFFTCGTGINYQPNSADTSLSDVDIIMELANRVAAGEVAAPTGFKSSASLKRGANAPLSFSTLVSEYIVDTNSIQESPRKELIIKISQNNTLFPRISWSDVLPSWDAVESLIFCLRMHNADYSEETYQELGGIIGCGSGQKSSLFIGRDSHHLVPLHSHEANTKLLTIFGSYRNGDAFHTYLLQILALISSQELFEQILTEMITSQSVKIDALSGNKKKDYVAQLNADAKVKTETICDEIVQAIVGAAMKNHSLCQSFHFLLRSFSSMLVKKKIDEGTTFEPIKTLTSAHILLRNRLMDADVRGTSSLESYESQINVCSRESIDAFESMESIDPDPKKKRGKRFGKIFRRGSKKGSSKEEKVNIEEDIVFTDDKKNAKKRNTFVPNSILRKSADQNPHNSMRNENNAILLMHSPSTATMFENMGWFLSNLDQLCGKVEDALLKSFSKKITEWALQPWSASKDRALANGTADMRNGLNVINLLGRSRSNENNKNWSPVINPVNPSESLDSIIPEESYILPSAHFPLLLAFNSSERTDIGPVRSKLGTNVGNEDRIYRTTVKISLVRGEEIHSKTSKGKKYGFAYIVHATVGSEIKETGKSSLDPYYESSTHRWHENNNLQFETCSSTGCPETLSLRLSSISFESKGGENIALSDESGTNYYSSEVGFSFLNLSELWKKGSSSNLTTEVNIFDYNAQPDFDQQGLLIEDMKICQQKLTIELQISTEIVSPTRNDIDISNLCKRRLLYKHDEDMRQEMLATQLLDASDNILKASGLDLKIKKYKCVPVGEKKGFIEWVPGVFALSEICKPMGSLALSQHPNITRGGTRSQAETDNHGNDSSNSAFIRTGNWCQFESLRSLRHNAKLVCNNGIGLSGDNPVQDFFRTHAYDENAPYLIRRDVMDNFVKSCAGYSVITYILGVGDRHTDNLLLHPKGYFLHCDYSFILGQDPKTYQPMRITEHMVNGMGGRDSDNFAKFLSLAGAAFVTLRRHPSVRVLLSIVRTMTYSEIPDVSMNQTPDIALQSMFERFRLDLNDDEAVSFLEENIERSISSKVWIAVDAIHSLGKRF